jgi:hypothetical protein
MYKSQSLISKEKKAKDLSLRKMFFRLDINVKMTKLEFMFNLK